MIFSNKQGWSSVWDVRKMLEFSNWCEMWEIGEKLWEKSNYPVRNCEKAKIVWKTRKIYKNLALISLQNCSNFQEAKFFKLKKLLWKI